MGIHVSRLWTSWRTWVACTLGLGLLFAGLTATNGGAATTTITTTGDSFVTSQYQNANRGSAKEIRADVEGKNLRTGYVKFAVPSISGTITSASLELDVKNAKPAGFMIHNTSDFNEMTINYKNAPSVGTMAGFVNSAKKGHISVDVTRAVAANRTVAFAIVSTGRTIFSSKEAGSSVAPKLKIDSATATTGAPSTSTTARATTSTTAQATTSTTRAASTVPTVPGTSDCKSATFCADFSTKEDFYNRFDRGYSGIDVFDWNGGGNNGAMKEFHGDHNENCEGPTTDRTVHFKKNTDGSLNFDELFWYCAPGGDAAKGHVMTGLDTLGYNMAWFSPKPIFTNVQKVCWDINVTSMSHRKWTQVMFVDARPGADATRYPAGVRTHGNQAVARGTGGFDLGYTAPDFRQDAPNDGIMPAGGTLAGLRQNNSNFSWFQDQDRFTDTFVGWTPNGYETNDKATRVHNCMENMPNNKIRVTQVMPAGLSPAVMPQGGTRVLELNGQIPQHAVRVVFEDDNYDGAKDQHYVSNVVTWHWDNIQVNAR